MKISSSSLFLTAVFGFAVWGSCPAFAISSSSESLAQTTELATANAAAQQHGIRVEVADAETDHGDYTIFTYKDTDDDASFGYYFSLGRTSNFLGADEILGMQVKNEKEVTICLGATCDEALATLESIIDLFDKDVDTSVEFQGRSSSTGERLGEPTTSTCVVKKKPLGGKRLEFIFTVGERQAHAFLAKTVVKELRTELKMDIKLHPKHHRKK